MKNLFVFFALIVGLSLLISCGDDEPEMMPEDMSGLSITIHSPANNTVFNQGDTIVLSYTVTDDTAITTIAWDTNSQFGTGSVVGSEFIDVVTEYSGEFFIPATAVPGTYDIDVNATDEGFENVKEESVTVIIQ